MSNATIETTKGLMALHVSVSSGVSHEKALEAVEAEFRTDEIVTAQTTIETVQRALERVNR